MRRVPGAGQLGVEREDGVDLHLLALGLAALVPLHRDGARLQVDPGDDRRVNPPWKGTKNRCHFFPHLVRTGFPRIE